MNSLFNMTEAAVLFTAFSAGLVLGAFYFIALWKTVQRLPSAKNPARLMLISFVARLAVVLVAFYFLMEGHWERLAAALIGFIIMKTMLTGHLGRKEPASGMRHKAA